MAGRKDSAIHPAPRFRRSASGRDVTVSRRASCGERRFVVGVGHLVRKMGTCKNGTKSLSEKPDLAHTDVSACDVYHGKEVVDFLFPPYEKSAEAVHPGMRAFDNPAASAVAGYGFAVSVR